MAHHLASQPALAARLYAMSDFLTRVIDGPPTTRPCPECNGRGVFACPGGVECWVCCGTGEVEIEQEGE